MANEPAEILIDMREDLDVAQRALLVAKPENETGIVNAWFAGGYHHCLIIHYAPEHFSHETLLDTIRLQGCHVRIVDS
jgi:hypothetical protein